MKMGACGSALSRPQHVVESVAFSEQDAEDAEVQSREQQDCLSVSSVSSAVKHHHQDGSWPRACPQNQRPVGSSCRQCRRFRIGSWVASIPSFYVASVARCCRNCELSEPTPCLLLRVRQSVSLLDLRVSCSVSSWSLRSVGADGRAPGVAPSPDRTRTCWETLQAGSACPRIFMGGAHVRVEGRAVCSTTRSRKALIDSIARNVVRSA
jgi:hypothetical protein